MASNIVDLHACSGETRHNEIARLKAEVKAWRAAVRVLNAGISTPEGPLTYLRDLNETEVSRSKLHQISTQPSGPLPKLRCTRSGARRKQFRKRL
jgi:hypothetical protein